LTGIKVTLPRPEGRVEVDIVDVRPEEWPGFVALQVRYGANGWDVARKMAEWIREHGARLSAGEG
jgi:hypothetical protein